MESKERRGVLKGREEESGKEERKGAEREGRR